MKKSLTGRYRKLLPPLIAGASALQKDILSALAYAPASGTSATQLALLLGQKDKVVINGAFGRLGRSLWQAVQEHPDGYQDKDDFEWWTMLATMQFDGAEFRWILRPEVLAVVAPQLPHGPDIAAREGRLKEGRPVSRPGDVYERNPIARRRCLHAHGYACAACGVLLSDVYGPIADQYTHVHHLRPLKADGVEHDVDPVRDLRPVCPNCHAVIHLRPDPFTIDEIRTLIGRQPGGQRTTSSRAKR